MEGQLAESGRTIGISGRESKRLEDRVAALESVVIFLVSRISEDQKRPIKSELGRLKQAKDASPAYEDWPDNPMEW